MNNVTRYIGQYSILEYKQMANNAPKIEVKETYERVVTPKELVTMAKEMFAMVKKTPTEDRSKLFLEFYRIKREVCQAYPIVVKMMCYLDLFSPKIFEKYIILSAKMPRKTEEEYHAIQAKYVRMLYKWKYPRQPPKFYAFKYTQTLQLLAEEATEYKRSLQDAEEKVKSAEKQYGKELRNDLISKAKAGAPSAGLTIVAPAANTANTAFLNLDGLNIDAPPISSSSLFE